MKSALPQNQRSACRKVAFAAGPRSLVFGLLATVGFPSVVAAQQVVVVSSATLTRCDGMVQTVDAAGQATDAYVQAKLLPGQMLRTGAAGSAELELDGGGAVRVDGNSEVKISEAKDGKPAPGSLEMLKGKLFLNIDSEALKKASNREFRLKTPVAVLAVKGTKFFAFSSEKGDTFGVHEGMVAVAEPQSKQVRQLKAGTAAEVSAGKLTALRALSQVEQAYGFTYPRGSGLGWVVPIENGERCLTIGFIQTSNGNRYFLRKSATKSNFFDEMWREKDGGKHEVVFRCKDLQSPPRINQILAGPDDSLHVWSSGFGLYRLRGDRLTQVLENSALLEGDLRDAKHINGVSFGYKPDGTVDAQKVYHSSENGLAMSTWITRKKAPPPVRCIQAFNSPWFIMSGSDDGYSISKSASSVSIQHFRVSMPSKQHAIVLACSEMDPNLTVGLWPPIVKPPAKP